jgi:glycosyltransferase involved in cell wall biosynthesis
MKKIVFVGAHDLMVPYINDLAKTEQVFVYESGVFRVPLGENVTVRPLAKTLGGLERYLRGERSAPWYFRGLSDQLTHDEPEVIVVLDFIRFWYWQVLWYRFFHKTVRVFVYSESQQLPRSLVSRLAFLVFFLVFYVSQGLIDRYLTFTKRGALFAKEFGVLRPITSVPPPVDVERFRPVTDLPETVAPGLRILMNARYVTYKRHWDLLEAVAALRRQGVIVALTLVGRDGSGQAVVLEQVNRLGLQPVVTFLPPVPYEEVGRVYRQHDVLVLPSDNEAIGMVVPEAMACGLTTVTSDTVGANVYVIPGVTGCVFKTGDIAALTAALQSLTDASRLQQYKEAALVHIKEYTITNLAGSFRACTLGDN